FVDYNRVQLSDSLEKIMPIDLPATFKAGGWKVLEIDGHDYQEIWDALSLAEREKDLPIVIIGHTIMGKGVDFMEEDGLKFKAEWHGKAPKIEMAAPVLKKLELNSNEKNIISTFHSSLNWRPLDPDFTPSLARNNLNPGTPRLYDTTTLTDCRSAYGKALLDLAKLNPEIVAITADLSGSVMTKYVMEELPERHFDCGIAEQHMVSMAGGLSLKELIPFVSTFGAFISSRAKDQARVNDINRTNLKMVATHCGLSVGEDGPTHQSIDDMGSFLGLLNTMIIEPVDPNQTDHIIRYIACHYGNFYVRMGRHKFPVITKKDGRIYFDQNYQFYYGKCDLIREGKDCTIIATGAMVSESLKAIEKFSSYDSNFSVELISASSIKKFDETLLKSVQKTKKIITVEDHNTYNGLGSQIALYLALKNIHVKLFKTIGVDHYQLSGKVEELYKAAKIDSEAISKTIISLKSYT
ncbi:transketolase, partial [Candidatus Peregrinibacteria bacterium]|nr:transketolase [Candidatus Peregrinibacteria bacterium]